jgi:hypothetical protein
MKDNSFLNILLSITGYTAGTMLSNVNYLFSITAFGLTIIFTLIKIRKELNKR